MPDSFRLRAAFKTRRAPLLLNRESGRSVVYRNTENDATADGVIPPSAKRKEVWQSSLALSGAIGRLGKISERRTVQCSHHAPRDVSPKANSRTPPASEKDFV